MNLGQKQKANDNQRILLQKVGGLWHGLAINQGQTKVGKGHKDYRDAKDSYNCVIPYGDWQGGDLT